MRATLSHRRMNPVGGPPPNARHMVRSLTERIERVSGQRAGGGQPNWAAGERGLTEQSEHVEEGGGVLKQGRVGQQPRAPALSWV